MILRSIRILKLGTQCVSRQMVVLGLIVAAIFGARAAGAAEIAFGFAARFGTTGSDFGKSIAVGPSGKVYSTGAFQGTVDFDPGPGVFNLTAVAFNHDVFVCCLDASGAFLWAKSMGGVDFDEGNGIVVDDAGNVYITGQFSTLGDFDPGPGTFNLVSAGFQDAFVCKLDASGDFLWAKAMGGSVEDEGNSIALDESGNVYTAGFFANVADFDPGAGTFNLTSGGLTDGYVSKLDGSGNFVWAASMGGGSTDRANAIALDRFGNAFNTGRFVGTVDFDPGPSIFNLSSTGGSDLFVQKLDPAGDFLWAVSIGAEEALGVAVDGQGSVFTTGYYSQTIDFDPGPATFPLTSGFGSTSSFVQKLDSTGSFVWAVSTDGTGDVVGNGIAHDGIGNILVTGEFENTIDLDPGLGTAEFTSAGQRDLFIQNLDSLGGFLYATATGSNSTDLGVGIAADALGNAYTTGLFNNTVDFYPGPMTFELTSAAAGSDIYVTKLVFPNVPSGLPVAEKWSIIVLALALTVVGVLLVRIQRFPTQSGRSNGGTSQLLD